MMQDSVVVITPAKHSCLPECMRPLQAVVVARIGANGHLAYANHGFERLLWRSGDDGTSPVDARSVFLNPRFDDLLMVHGAPGDAVFQGILTVVDQLDVSHSLIGAVHWIDGDLLLVAEHDIAEMQRLNSEVLALNLELTQAHRKLARAHRELATSEEKLKLLSVTDPLTGLANRRQLMDALPLAHDRCKRYGHQFSVIMADIDFFKKVNDEHGHATGDQVIKAVADMLARTVRAGDLVARFGGEEFVVLVQEAGLQEAFDLAERLRLGAAALVFDVLPKGIRCSFGVAPLSREMDTQQAVKQADEALYQSKREGRNRVTRYVPTP